MLMVTYLHREGFTWPNPEERGLPHVQGPQEGEGLQEDHRLMVHLPLMQDNLDLHLQGPKLLLFQVMLQCKCFSLIILAFLVIPVSVDAHIRRIDLEGIYPVPGVSPLQPIDSGNFTQNHLQNGLENDGNVCCLISIILCVHRLGLINSLIIPAQMSRNPVSPDFAIGVIAKILYALPSSNAFSLYTLKETWNGLQLGLVLDPPEDLYIIEGIFRHLRFRDQGGVPTLTKFTASYYCPQCQVNYSGITPPSFQVIPELSLPNQRNAVNPCDLVTDLITGNTIVTCQVCQRNIDNASYECVRGKVTFLRLNRLGYQDRQPYKIMTPLEFGPNNSPGSRLLGELVAVACHISGHSQEHWISYSKTYNGWYKNDDQRRPVPSSPFNTNEPGETINLLCYRN